MARIIRTLALTGAAAAALMGTAGTVHADTPEEATATVEAAVDRAAGTPVSLPSGKTVHVRGLDTAAYRTDAAHHDTVVTLTADTTTVPGIAGIDSSLRRGTEAGTGAAVGNPATYNQQQVQTQASGTGSISVLAALGIGLAIFTFLMVKKGRINAWHAFALVLFGVVLAPTTFGPMLQNLGVSAATGLGNVWSGF
ncbi:hypothetical protein ACFQ6E_16320 [Streptomyces sp. NPDC056462]|uniref:hypothetical protein n=1 Tax=Streptomyces sp. NPDC056462 TaxID=3345826 RepID=UPI00369F3DCD